MISVGVRALAKDDPVEFAETHLFGFSRDEGTSICLRISHLRNPIRSTPGPEFNYQSRITLALQILFERQAQPV